MSQSSLQTPPIQFSRVQNKIADVGGPTKIIQSRTNQNGDASDNNFAISLDKLGTKRPSSTSNKNPRKDEKKKLKPSPSLVAVVPVISQENKTAPELKLSRKLQKVGTKKTSPFLNKKEISSTPHKPHAGKNSPQIKANTITLATGTKSTQANISEIIPSQENGKKRKHKALKNKMAKSQKTLKKVQKDTISNNFIPKSSSIKKATVKMPRTNPSNPRVHTEKPNGKAMPTPSFSINLSQLIPTQTQLHTTHALQQNTAPARQLSEVIIAHIKPENNLSLNRDADTLAPLNIQLSPANLGKIHIRFQFTTNEQMTAHILTERPETSTLLRQTSDIFLGHLKSFGLDNMKLHFDNSNSQSAFAFNPQSGGGHKAFGHHMQFETAENNSAISQEINIPPVPTSLRQRNSALHDNLDIKL